MNNLNTSGWIFGNITQEEYNKIRFNQSSTQNTALCDLENPFVIAGNNGQCGKCPTEKPIFVLSNSTCIENPINETKVSSSAANNTNNITSINNTSPPNITSPSTNNTLPTEQP